MARDELPKNTARDDCLQREQLPAWFVAVRQIGNPDISAYLQAALLIGARREEVAGIRWKDVDFQWKALTIKDKVEGERSIPLLKRYGPACVVRAFPAPSPLRATRHSKPCWPPCLPLACA